MSDFTYYIHSPGNAIAGGCESLHQLGDAINNIGGKAVMCYYPYEETFDVPDKFSHYNIGPSILKDGERTVHIFPEVCTKFTKKIIKGQKCIFWLSVDNYYFKKDRYPKFKRLKKYYWSLFTARLPLQAMTAFTHLLQSEYSKIHIGSKNFRNFYIGDYIHFADAPELSSNKKPRILYNPAKGRHITESLKQQYPELDFFPLVGYTSDELDKIMNESLLYIDFGNHPGRDRLPREAVLRGTIVITGVRGSAGNDIDIPIPSAYKFDTSSATFQQDFKALVDEILKDPIKGRSDMMHYKGIVIGDKDAHREKVAMFTKKFEGLVSLPNSEKI